MRQPRQHCYVAPNGSVYHRFACDFGRQCPSPAGPRSQKSRERRLRWFRFKQAVCFWRMYA